MEVKRLKRAVIKEEFVTITKDFILAVILNQFVYWSDRVNDFDKMIEEERKIASKEGIELNQPLKHGWIYKKAEELIEETMLGISQTSMRNKIKLLVKMGFLTERDNPNYKWDHTKQYRVNFQKLKDELSKHGYSLQGYKVLENPENIESQNLSFEAQTEKDRISKFELHNSEFEEQYQRLHSEITNKEKNIKEKVDSDEQSSPPPPTETIKTAEQSQEVIGVTSKSDRGHLQKGELYTRSGGTYTEITSETSVIKENVKEKESVDYQGVIDLYNETCVSLPSVQKLTDKRKRALKSITKKFSVEDLKTVFKKAEESSFLNGSSDKWSGATFDWLIKEDNIVKVLEGNYDDKGKYNNFHSIPSYDIEEYEKNDNYENYLSDFVDKRST